MYSRLPAPDGRPETGAGRRRGSPSGPGGSDIEYVRGGSIPGTATSTCMPALKTKRAVFGSAKTSSRTRGVIGRVATDSHRYVWGRESAAFGWRGRGAWTRTTTSPAAGCAWQSSQTPFSRSWSVRANWTELSASSVPDSTVARQVPQIPPRQLCGRRTPAASAESRTGRSGAAGKVRSVPSIRTRASAGIRQDALHLMVHPMLGCCSSGPPRPAAMAFMAS